MNATCLGDIASPKQNTISSSGTASSVLEDVLPPSLVRDLTVAVDRLDAEFRPKKGLGPHDLLNLLDFIGKDDLFLELLDWPRTFPKVWGILGWHIQLYHTHMNVTPAAPPGEEPPKKRLQWHQDSGRLNADLETDPAHASRSRSAIS